MSQRSLRKTRELEWRRHDLLSAAERLFSKRGFFKTSMADIAEAAEFAIGTVYQFFRSKEEIYISLIEAKMEEFERLLEARMVEASSATEQLGAVIRTKLEYFEENRNFFRIYVTEWSGFEWTMKSAFGERCWKRYQVQLDLVADVIRSGMRQGEFRALDPHMAAFALHGMLNSTIYLWILQARPSESLVAKAESLLALFIHGAGAAETTRRQSRVRRASRARAGSGVDRMGDRR